MSVSQYAIALALLVVWILQSAWCIYYSQVYKWRRTPLGSVWLAKGSVLALLWLALGLDQTLDVPDWVFGFVIGPLLIATTARWLYVTVMVARCTVDPGGVVDGADAGSQMGR